LHTIYYFTENKEEIEISPAFGAGNPSIQNLTAQEDEVM
jgi:hypothetical protein